MKLSEVLWYTEQHGYKHPLPVLPLGGKYPLKGTHGCNSATTDWEVVRNWWGAFPNANVGIATGKKSGLVVIDIDQKPEKGKFGEECLQELEMELGELPATWEVFTGSGGRHLYFRYPKDVSYIRSRNGYIATYVDIKADGGYVVAPPSIHPDTKRPYEWEYYSYPHMIPLADLPETWVDVLTGKRKTWYQRHRETEEEKQRQEQGIAKGRFVLPDKIYHGERNDVLFSYARSLYARGKDEDEVIRMLNEANAEKCETPLSGQEIEAINKSAKKYQDKNNSIIFHSFSEGNNTTPDTEKQVSEVTKNEVSEVPPEEDPKGDYEIMEPGSSLDPNIDPFLPDISRFHKFLKGDPYEVYDERIVNNVLETDNFFFIGSGQGSIVYFYQDGVYNASKGKALLAQAVEKRIYEDVRSAPIIARVLRRFPQKPQCLVTPDDLDKQEPRYVHFQNGYYDPLEQKIIPHNPTWRTLNTIPYDFDPKEKTESAKIDAWLRFAFPDDEDREVFLQYLGYCMTADNSRKKFLWIRGKSDSGKTVVGKLVEHMVGTENTSDMTLMELTTEKDSTRFAKLALFGKLVNSVCETSCKTMESLSFLKTVTGGDRICGEPKGGQRIAFYPKTKFIFLTNFAPRTSNEGSDAFFKRGIFLHMDQVAENLDENFLKNTLLPDIGHLYHLCMGALHRMYAQGGFSIPKGSIEERDALFYVSDHVQRWLDSCVVVDPKNKERLKKTVAYNSFKLFCLDENIAKEKILSSGEWLQALRDKNIYPNTYHGYPCLPVGYALKKEET